MRVLVRTILYVWISSCLSAAVVVDSPIDADRKAFFYSLRPGIQRAEIILQLGVPDRLNSERSFYQLQQGEVGLLYLSNGYLKSATHFAPSSAVVSRSLYFLRGEDPLSQTQLRNRSRALQEQDFYGSFQWQEEPSVSTQNHPGGRAYLLSEGYAVLEFFWGVSKATIYGSKEPGVVYRAFEHWSAHRPAELTDEELHRRSRLLQRPAAELMQARISESWGKADKRRGSGRDFRLYYLTEGVLQLVSNQDRILEMKLIQPGKDVDLPLASWQEKIEKD